MNFVDWGLLFFWLIAAGGLVYSAIQYFKLSPIWYFIGIAIVAALFTIYVDKQNSKKKKT